jgi:hypothetical protein
MSASVAISAESLHNDPFRKSDVPDVSALQELDFLSQGSQKRLNVRSCLEKETGLDFWVSARCCV